MEKETPHPDSWPGMTRPVTRIAGEIFRAENRPQEMTRSAVMCAPQKSANPRKECRAEAPADIRASRYYGNASGLPPNKTPFANPS